MTRWAFFLGPINCCSLNMYQIDILNRGTLLLGRCVCLGVSLCRVRTKPREAILCSAHRRIDRQADRQTRNCYMQPLYKQEAAEIDFGFANKIANNAQFFFSFALLLYFNVWLFFSSMQLFRVVFFSLFSSFMCRFDWIFTHTPRSKIEKIYDSEFWCLFFLL